MAFQTVLYEKLDHIVTVTLNRPEALNAFNPQLRADLLSALKQAEGDDEVRCIILTGAGRAFSAGADVAVYNRIVQAREEAETAPSPLATPLPPHEDHLSCLMGLTKPVIAALNGVAVGMGATIPLACDLRIVSASARMAFLFVKRGLIGEFGAHFLLTKLVGYGQAKDLFMTGRFVDATEAKAIGLVNYVAPDDKFEAATRELAQTLASHPPISLKFIKRAVNLSLDSSMRNVVEFEDWGFATCQRSEDFKEGIHAFLEKRAPKFRGR